MIAAEIIKEIDPEYCKNDLLRDIIDDDELIGLEYGYTGEQDHEAPDGYILELVIRRKCVK